MQKDKFTSDVKSEASKWKTGKRRDALYATGGVLGGAVVAVGAFFLGKLIKDKSESGTIEGWKGDEALRLCSAWVCKRAT